jgi:hypothetical protein
MASFDPEAGKTCVSGSSPTPCRRRMWPAKASRSFLVPVALGYRLTSGTPSTRALAYLWVGGFAGVAGAEIEER